MMNESKSIFERYVRSVHPFVEKMRCFDHKVKYSSTAIAVQ